MHQTALRNSCPPESSGGQESLPKDPIILHVLDVESGQWHGTQLGSPVSSRILEAMNLILSKDGILAYIGTREGFGSYVVQLDKRPKGDSIACWISLPASTLMSMLGLSLSIMESGKPEMVFYGSPLTVMLACQLEALHRGAELAKAFPVINPWIYVSDSIWDEISGFVGASNLNYFHANEYHEALSYAQG